VLCSACNSSKETNRDILSRQWPTRDDEGYCSTCSYHDAAQLCRNTRLRSTGRHTRSSGAPGWGDDSSLAKESTYENQSKELALG
jgi:hypothetical protein